MIQRKRCGAVAALSMIVLGGCLEPIGDDTVVRESLILAPGTDVKAIALDGEVALRIEANDEVEGDQVKLVTAFVNGKQAHFWNFGPTVRTVAPLFRLVRSDPAGTIETPKGRYSPVEGHLNVIDVVPGDPGYSPFWVIRLVPVTERYAGEVLPSAAAIAEAVATGLAEEPIEIDFVVNCPVVLSHVTLESLAEMTAPGIDAGYYRGRQIAYYDFGPVAMVDGTVKRGRAFQLRREGGEPLSEPFRGVDISGDGDRRDTNDVLTHEPGDAGYSGLVERVEVVVSSTYRSIDDAHDDAVADITDADQIMVGGDPLGEPDSSVVRAFYPRGDAVNWPIAWVAAP